MMQTENVCPIHEAYEQYLDAADAMNGFNPEYQRALAKNRVTRFMTKMKETLCKELREAYKALRTELFLAGELPAEKWNDQRAVLAAAENYC
jgi:hypothetical protein